MPNSHSSSGDQVQNLLAAISSCISPDGDRVRGGHAVAVDIYALADSSKVCAYEAALRVAAEVRLDEVLQRLVDEARALSGASVAVLTVTSGGGTVESVFVSGPGTAQTYAYHDFSLDGRWTSTVLHLDSSLFLPHADRRDAGINALMGVPITLDDGWQGNLFVMNPASNESFTRDDLQMLETMASHVAPTINRAARYSTLEMGREQRESELAQLRTILDTLPAGVLVLLPPDGHIESGNRTALSTVLADDASPDAMPRIYRDFRWLDAAGVELPRSRHPGMRALRGETVPNRALVLQVASGKKIPVRVQSAPILNGNGEVVRAVVMFFDVTRERAAEQVKDDFLSLISHEFRTPLTAIHGGAHLLAQQGDALDAETRDELLKDIGEESARLDRMLGNLLSVAEIMAGRFQASTEPILVAPFVQPLIEEFRKRSMAHAFSLSVEQAVPPAEGDPELLIQILRNLYENAVKYSPGGGDIRTVVRRQGSWVAVEVTDYGLGIAPDHVPHVFERFRRPGADPTVRGMGLGLYLSRLLVDAQGGRIRAASEGPGKGATFVVELPIIPDWEKGYDGARGAEHRS